MPILPPLIQTETFDFAPVQITRERGNEYGDDDVLNSIIQKTQMTMGIKILGSIEYNKFVADYDSVGGVFQSQEWIDFFNGVSGGYLVDGKTVVWDGFANLLPYFVYFDYYQYTGQRPTTLGTAVANAENGTIVSNNYAIRNWNDAYDLWVGRDWKGLFSNCNDGRWWDRRTERPRPNIYVKHFDTDTEQYKATAYNYIENHRDLYSDWKFSFEENPYINSFGI